jgi:hypothetical protein
MQHIFRRKGTSMSFQAYLDTVEKKTGLTPRQLINIAHERGFGPGTKAASILTWLSEDYGLGRGHGMAMVHVITRGDSIGSKHVGTGSSHSDATDHLWLDGIATKPEVY